MSTKRALASCYKPSKHIISVSAVVCPKFQIAILGGGCEPTILGKRRTQGVRDGTVRKRVGEFLQAVHSNFSSIFTRFQRYCLFCSSACHFFPTPPLVSPKFPNVPLGLGGSPFGYKERRCWANCACNQFSRFLHLTVPKSPHRQKVELEQDNCRVLTYLLT